MQTIETKYYGPTQCRGARITAKASGGARITVSRAVEARRIEDDHDRAAYLLCRKLDWVSKFARGATKNGFVYVFFPHDAMLASRGRGPADDVLYVTPQRADQERGADCALWEKYQAERGIR